MFCRPQDCATYKCIARLAVCMHARTRAHLPCMVRTASAQVSSTGVRRVHLQWLMQGCNPCPFHQKPCPSVQKMPPIGQSSPSANTHSTKPERCIGNTQRAHADPGNHCTQPRSLTILQGTPSQITTRLSPCKAPSSQIS